MEITHAEPLTLLDRPVCAHCEINAPTRFLDPRSPYDECCEPCYAALFTECPRCQAIVRNDELENVQTATATRYDPAEYEDICANCRGGDESEPDPDAERDL